MNITKQISLIISNMMILGGFRSSRSSDHRRQSRVTSLNIADACGGSSKLSSIKLYTLI
jgi:hypothetical protein